MAPCALRCRMSEIDRGGTRCELVHLLALMAATCCAGAAFAQANTVGWRRRRRSRRRRGWRTVGAVVGAGCRRHRRCRDRTAPDGVVTYVERERAPSVTVREHVVVGQALPETVVIHKVPQHDDYAYAVVNNERVICRAAQPQGDQDHRALSGRRIGKSPAATAGLFLCR